MSNQQTEEVAALKQCVATIENFKSTTFRRSAEVIYGNYEAQDAWISENLPAEIFTYEYSNEGGSYHIFHCRNKKILDTFVDELESLFHF